jgi:hypothetical protein
MDRARLRGAAKRGRDEKGALRNRVCTGTRPFQPGNDFMARQVFDVAPQTAQSGRPLGESLTY